MRIKLLKDLLNPGGGLRYHARATLHRSTRWKGFRQGIAAWLQDWPPLTQRAEKDLLLVAPSGGHCLPGDWLGSFRSVTAADIDPLAPLVFRRLHAAAMGATPLHWNTLDVVKNWAALFSAHPSHAILFCNFLGQVQNCFPENEMKDWFQRLPATLQGRSWASFHDCYSGDPTPRRNAPPLECSMRADPKALMAHFYEAGAQGEWIEHELPPIFPESGHYRYWSWPLAAGQNHIIEGYQSR